MKNLPGNPMKKLLILASAILAAGILSCERNSTDDPTTQKGTPTETGKPIGPVTSKSIGPEGGFISTPDDKLTLKFPAGALKETRTITIRPVTNTAWNGIGQGFEFGPDGSSFEQPVEFIYRYSNEEVAGSSLQNMALAFQNPNGIWQLAQPVKVDQDTKTITGRINHFSWWSLVTEYRLLPESDSVVLKQTKELTLERAQFHGTFPFWKGKEPKNFEIDELLYLFEAKVADRTDIKKIYLNGIDFTSGQVDNQTYGTIGHVYGETGAKLLYTAPGKMPKSNNPVNIVVELQHSGGAQLMLVSTIDILFGDGMNVDGHITENVEVQATYSSGMFALNMLSLDAPAGKPVSINVMTKNFKIGKFPFDVKDTFVGAMNGPAGKSGASEYTHCNTRLAEKGFVVFENIYKAGSETRAKGQILGNVVVLHSDDHACNHTAHETMNIVASFDCVVRQ